MDDNILKNVLKSSSLEAIKLKTFNINDEIKEDGDNNNCIKWILDLRTCSFCNSIELHLQQNIKVLKMIIMMV